MTTNARAADFLEMVPPPMGDAMRNWMAYQRATGALIRATYLGTRQILETQVASETNREPKMPVLGNLIKREVDGDHPVLHGHSLMGMWSAFECFVEDVVIGYLVDDPSLAKLEPFERVSVPAAALLEPEDERAWILLEAARKPGGPGSGKGINKFESLLKLVGASGKVTPYVSNLIYDVQQIRNVWAHKGGFADRHFVKACPKLGYELGDQVVVSRADYALYTDALHMYATIIVCRHERTARSARFSDSPGFQGTLEELGLVSPASDSEPDTSAPESDAPPE